MVRSNKYCRQVIFAMSTIICASSAPEMGTAPTIAAEATSHVLNDLCDSDLADICSLRICPQSNHDSIGILADSHRGQCSRPRLGTDGRYDPFSSRTCLLKTGAAKMPWTENDAERHTRKATTSELKALWAKVANERRARTGDE